MWYGNNGDALNAWEWADWASVEEVCMASPIAPVGATIWHLIAQRTLTSSREKSELLRILVRKAPGILISCPNAPTPGRSGGETGNTFRREDSGMPFGRTDSTQAYFWVGWRASPRDGVRHRIRFPTRQHT